MKKFGILSLILGLAFSFAGCNAAKEKMEEAKDAGANAVEDVKDKAMGGDVDGAMDAGKKGVEDVKDAVTGDDD